MIRAFAGTAWAAPEHRPPNDSTLRPNRAPGPTPTLGGPSAGPRPESFRGPWTSSGRRGAYTASGIVRTTRSRPARRSSRRPTALTDDPVHAGGRRTARRAPDRLGVTAGPPRSACRPSPARTPMPARRIRRPAAPAPPRAGGRVEGGQSVEAGDARVAAHVAPPAPVPTVGTGVPFGPHDQALSSVLGSGRDLAKRNPFGRNGDARARTATAACPPHGIRRTSSTARRGGDAKPPRRIVPVVGTARRSGDSRERRNVSRDFTCEILSARADETAARRRRKILDTSRHDGGMGIASRNVPRREHR